MMVQVIRKKAVSVSRIEVLDIDYAMGVLVVKHLANTLHSDGKYNATIPFRDIVKYGPLYRHIFIGQSQVIKKEVDYSGSPEV